MNKIKTRKITQNVFLGIWLVVILLLIPHKFGVSHQFCPFSVICFGPLNITGMSIYLPMVIIGLLIALSTIFFGRIFCSYACFLGTIQEHLFKLNPRKKRVLIPLKLHKTLSAIKYLILALTFVCSVLFIQYMFMPFCPVIAISLPKSISIFGIISLFIFFAGSFFIERFWCRYFCPYGALMNLFQIVGKKLKIKRKYIFRNMEVCIDCYQCTKECPMNINLLQYEEITDPNCIFCYNCIEKCPKKSDCINVTRC